MIAKFVLSLFLSSSAYAITGFVDGDISCPTSLSTLTASIRPSSDALLDQITGRHFQAQDLKGSLFYDFTRFPPLTMDAIRAVRERDFTMAEISQEMHCGTCSDMLHRFFRTFILPTMNSFEPASTVGLEDFLVERQDVKRKFVLIYVKGHLVGVVKTYGELSFLALRNVINSKGKIMLAMGGVYALPKKLEKTFQEQREGVARLDQLLLRPEVFLYSSRAPLDGRNQNILKTLFGRTDDQVWSPLLERLNWLRVKLEGTI